jgi:hypothetical protein
MGLLQVANTQTEPALQIQLICLLLNHEYESGTKPKFHVSNPAPAQEYSDPPLLIGLNLQLAGSSIYQKYFIFILLILCVVQVVSPY